MKEEHRRWCTGAGIPTSNGLLRTAKYKTREHQRKPVRGQELCESRGGHPGLPVPNSPYGLCGRKATMNLNMERGGRSGWAKRACCTQ